MQTNRNTTPPLNDNNQANLLKAIDWGIQEIHHYYINEIHVHIALFMYLKGDCDEVAVAVLGGKLAGSLADIISSREGRGPIKVTRLLS